MTRAQADVRPWLTKHPRAAPAMARRRIEESYDHIDGILGRFGGGLHYDRALDVGCGFALDTFALARRFEAVAAIDSSRVRVLPAALLARRARVDGIRFRRADAERFSSRLLFDFVYCNIMSEQSSARARLVANIGRLTAPHGAAYYAEATEGYPALEIWHAIEARDAATLRVRLHQVVDGFCGFPRFRFYAAGSATPLFAKHGFTVLAQEQRSWNNLVCVDALWLRRDADRAAEAAVADPDYAELDPDFAAVRERFRAALAGRAHSLPEDDSHRFAPYLVLLQMAQETLGPDVGNRRSMRERIRTRLRRVPEPDWTRVADLMAEFNDRIAASSVRAPGAEAAGSA